jgi:REP element-mobilizing transposase RayT
MNIFNKVTKELYFMTDTVVDWVDIFTRPTYKHIIVESLQYCQAQKGLEIYAWVLTSNHLHTIVSSKEGIKIGDIWRDFKKYTSKKILATLEEDMRESRREWMLDRFEFRAKNDKRISKYKFWQDGNDGQQIFSIDYLEQKLNYIHNNPVKSEFVSCPENYLYSSAIDYAGGKGLLKVELL